MANDVKVVIELSKASPKAGFGFPLIFAGKQSTAVAYKEVTSLEEVKSAGFAEDGDVYKAAQLLYQQDNAPTKIAVFASADAAVTALPTVLEEGWRQLIVVSIGETDESDVEAISDYVEACKKPCIFFTHVANDDTETLAAIKGNERTVAVVYDTASGDTKFPEAAVVGATSGMVVGSFTYKNIILKGVLAQSLTDSEVDNLHAAGAITILRKAGDIVTSEGKTTSGEYIDIVDTEDYLITEIEYQCQSLLNRVPKLPFDNRGIASLEGVVLSVLKEAADNGMIAQDDGGEYQYSVTFGGRSDCDPVDISTRTYNEGTFEFTLAGAIHNATIKGTIIA